MPSYLVKTPQRCYQAVVERGVLARAADYLPQSPGKIFVISTRDVWDLHGKTMHSGLKGRPYELLFFPGGETRKRLAEVEELAAQMIAEGGDRASLIVAFGGGIATDVAGFLAAIFMRGIPVVQVPTTLLAQVDAAVGGKTGVNLVAGKNLIGSFHQPLCVLIDPGVLETLPDREYRAGLFEIVKHGVIADAELFLLTRQHTDKVLARCPELVDRMISDSVRIKAEVVSADEKENDLRRILNFGHTFGHALEAETGYGRFLHGEAVGWGMLVATRLARLAGIASEEDASEILAGVRAYDAPDRIAGLNADSLIRGLQRDKKTVLGKVHFVLPDRIGHVRILSGIDPWLVRRAIGDSLAC